jgi:hypothetical protein
MQESWERTATKTATNNTSDSLVFLLSLSLSLSPFIFHSTFFGPAPLFLLVLLSLLIVVAFDPSDAASVSAILWSVTESDWLAICR